MSRPPEDYPRQRRERWMDRGEVAIASVIVGAIAYAGYNATASKEPLTKPLPHKAQISTVKTIGECDGNATIQKPTFFPSAPGYTESTNPNTLAQKQAQDPTNLGVHDTAGNIKIGVGTLVCKETITGWLNNTERQWLTQTAATIVQAH